MSEEIEVSKGKTVRAAKVEKFTKALVAGKTQKEAAREAGITLAHLRRDGTLARAARELLARVEQDKLLKKETIESVARARALELMLQDEDLKVSLGAVRAVLNNGPQVAVQINNNLKTDPEVLESLKTLGIEMEDEDGEN